MAGAVRADVLLSLVLLAAGRLPGQGSNPSAIPRQANWFYYPEILCRSLDALGYIAGAWAPADKDSPVYLCGYPPGSRPADVPALIASAQANQREPLPPKVTFEVTGLHRTTADTITLTITIANPGEKAAAKQHLLACIQALYQTIGRAVPSALPAYLEKEEHYLAHEPYGTVSLFTTSRHDGGAKPPEQIVWFRLGRNH
jgi:hypothetical protein